MSSSSFYDMSGVDDSLSAAQEAQVQQQTHQIMNVVKNLQPHESFMPHVISNILTEEQWNALDNHLKHHCVQLCIRAQIVCSKPKQSKAGASLGALYWGETFAHGKTAAEQNAINAAGKNSNVPAWDLITPVSGFQGPADPRLSQLIYCFQHYANAAKMGIRNPELPQNPPTNSMSPDVPSRTGVLDQQTMNDLQSLLKSRLIRVGANEIHILGKIFGAKLLCSLKWDSLDAQFDRLRAEAIENIAVSSKQPSFPGSKIAYDVPALIDQSLNRFDPNVVELLSAQQNAQLQKYPQVYNLVGDIHQQRQAMRQVANSPKPQTSNPSFQPPKPINTIPLDPRRRGF